MEHKSLDHSFIHSSINTSYSHATSCVFKSKTVSNQQVLQTPICTHTYIYDILSYIHKTLLFLLISSSAFFLNRAVQLCLHISSWAITLDAVCFPVCLSRGSLFPSNFIISHQKTESGSPSPLQILSTYWIPLAIEDKACPFHVISTPSKI